MQCNVTWPVGCPRAWTWSKPNSQAGEASGKWHNSDFTLHTRHMDYWLPHPLGASPYRHWLCQPGSLTRALQHRCPLFRVARLRQNASKPYADEYLPLGLVPGLPALTRDVLLLCADQPVVYAHTVVPLPGLRGPWQGLSRLGNRPLGAALFANPRVERFPLEFRKLGAQHALYRAARRDLAEQAGMSALPAQLWARRSLFALGQFPILVTEVFLPKVLNL